MKKIALLCLLLAAASLPPPARADMIIVELMKNGYDTATITTKIKGDKSRTDISSQSADTGDTTKSSIIVNVATGDIITLVHETKNFVKFSTDKTRGLVDDIQKSKTSSIASPRIVDTGKSEKVGAYNTEIYTSQSGSTKYTYWVTRDFPDFATVQEQMRKFQIRQIDLKRKLGMKDDLSPDVWQLDGMAVKTVILTEARNEKGEVMPMATLMTLVTARNQALDDADFQVPADYTEMEPPQQQAPPPAPAPQ